MERPIGTVGAAPQRIQRPNPVHGRKKLWRTWSPGLAPISSTRPARSSRTPLAAPFDGRGICE